MLFSVRFPISSLSSLKCTTKMHSSEYCQQLPKLSWRFWDISNASFTVRLTDFRFDCTVLNHVTSWRSFQTFQRKCKHNLLSINTIVHSHYMPVPEDKETPGLHGWGTNWLTGPLPDFCIVNKLVPLDNKQSPQTPLIDSTDFPCIRLGNCPTFRAIHEEL